MCVLTLKISHRPDGKMADVLASTPASTTAADAPVNYRMYVPQRPSMFPIAPMGKWLTCLPRLSLAQLRPTLRSTTDGTCHRDLEFSHRSDGRLTFCSLFVQGGGVSVESGTVSIVNSQVYSNQATNVRARLQKFPLPPWETHVLLVACRAAVSLSRVAL